MRSIRLSTHVVLVRPAPRLRRVAPGVQMLLTTDTANVLAPLVVSQAPAAPVSPVRLASDAASVDPRFKLFQALFALIEQDPPAAAALVPSQVAEASFAVVSDVDDFARP